MRRLLATTLTLASALAFTHGPAAAVRQEEPPRVTNPSRVAYPVIARTAHVEGVVNVDVEIDAEGRVTSARPDEGAHLLLRRAAEDAARRWTFAPSATGTAPRTARLTFEFRLEVVRPGDEEQQRASPYHVVIRPPKRNTVSHVPPDADNMVCEVHGYKLERDKVRIVYGLAVLNPDYEDAALKLFPRAQTEWGGGCVISDESPEFAEVLFCAACRAAMNDWLSARRAAARGGD